MSSRIDDINRRTMKRRAVVAQYARNDQLMPPERAALDRVLGEVRGRAILDIGVGGGRTVDALLEVSPDYLGIDYSEAMVQAARALRPHARFRHADARDLSFLADGSIALAMFSCNGIAMVGHEDRLKILRELHRVLEPGGVLIMSTPNLDGPELTSGFRFPPFEPSLNPARLAVRSLRFLSRTALRVFNRWWFREVGYRADDHVIHNDVCHDFGVMLYFISLANQRAQLASVGFQPDALAFDLSGNVIVDRSTEDSILFLARK